MYSTVRHSRSLIAVIVIVVAIAITAAAAVALAVAIVIAIGVGVGALAGVHVLEAVVLASVVLVAACPTNSVLCHVCSLVRV